MPKHLHRDLEDLSKEILTLGARVEESLNKAIIALLERRGDLADEVIEADLIIDQREIEVEENCLKILALHQPVAADLRFVITVMKVNNDLERMGDHAVGIAGRVKYLSTHDPIEVGEELQAMAEKVRDMVRLSLDSLVNRDPDKAREVCRMDSEVDEIHRAMFARINEIIQENPDTSKRGIQSLSVSRHLERVADLATNIAQDLVFMVEGEVIRHSDIEG